jgi:WD40 repeat protein
MVCLSTLHLEMPMAMLFQVWDLIAAKLIKTFPTATGEITGVEYHPYEYMLAASCSDGGLYFWDLDTFAEVGSANVSTGAALAQTNDHFW